MPQSKIAKKRILIIDDNLDLLETLTEFLESKYEVKNFLGSQEALAYLNQDHLFDLIICDYTMPMMSGSDFLRHLRKNGILTPIIFLTGNVSLELTKEALRLGAMDVVDKPISPTTLQGIIERVIMLEEARETYYREKAAGVKKNKMLGIMIAGNTELNRKIDDDKE